MESVQVKKLLDDRMEFKSWSAQRPVDKLEKIEKSHDGIMGKTWFMQGMNWTVSLRK